MKTWPQRMFHLSLKVPHGPARARSLCGYSLREGARFETLGHFKLECERKLHDLRPTHINAFHRVRGRNALHAFKWDHYWDNICPECLEHPEYVLTLLADLP
jgi:hypothetical protein